MCRISTLYPCINAKRKEFYEKHIQEYDSKIIDDMGNDDLIYVPDVVVLYITFASFNIELTVRLAEIT